MEGKRAAVVLFGFSTHVLLPMSTMVFLIMSAVPSSSSLRDPFVGLQPRNGGGGGADVVGSSSYPRCCNECSCVENWCVCSDRSRFGCYKDCGFCQCYDKPERTCYCVDVLHKCPKPCVVGPDGEAAPPAPSYTKLAS